LLGVHIAFCAAATFSLQIAVHAEGVNISSLPLLLQGSQGGHTHCTQCYDSQ
jgi:hypothetical protein